MPADTQLLIDCSRLFYANKWMWGTAGNLSVKQNNHPLEFTVTPSGVSKGTMEVSDLLTIKAGKAVTHPRGFKPSAETQIHQAIYEAIPQAQAVFHAHPMHCTILSGLYGDPHKLKSMPVEWIEMMKAYGVAENVLSQIPVFPNWQDVSKIAEGLKTYANDNKGKILPAMLIYNHGATVWGTTPEEARNYLEVLEYVCEFLYLKRLLK